jgi:hypothetical protein
MYNAFHLMLFIFVDIRPVRLAEKPWLKVLFADLL